MPKRRHFFSIACGTVIALLIGVFYLTPLADRIEHRYGLALLYWLRGPIAPPQGAIVVAIDNQTMVWLRLASTKPRIDHEKLINCLPKKAVDDLGRIRGPSSLPRSVHACLIDELRGRGFPVIAFDILFSVAGVAGDINDSMLAEAIRRHKGTTILVGHESSTVDVEGAELLIEREMQPTAQFKNSAAATGLFLITRTGGPAYGHMRRIQGFAGTRSLPDEAFRLMRKRRPDTRLAAHEQKSKFAYFWHYGAAGSIVTVPMSEVLRGAMRQSVLNAAPDTAVFVGASDPKASNYVDLSPTFFRNRFGANISGVELAATAFLNLHAGHELRRLSPQVEAMLIVLFAFALGLFAHAGSRFAVIALPVIAVVFVFGSAVTFSEYKLFLPISTLVFVCMPVTFLVAIFVRYRFARTLIMRLAPVPVAQRMLRMSTDHRGVATPEDATVLFSDLIGSTKIGEILPEMEFSALLNTYFDTMTREIETHHGYVAAFTGDGVMAVFGSSDAGPDHATLACRAAVSAVRELRIVNLKNAKVGYPPIAMRIGINSGHVAEGEIGARDRFNYSVIGDAVNLAARLEQMGKTLFPGEKDVILVGAASYCVAKDKSLSFSDCGTHEIPGREAEENVFRLKAPAI